MYFWRVQVWIMFAALWILLFIYMAAGFQTAFLCALAIFIIGAVMNLIFQKTVIGPLGSFASSLFHGGATGIRDDKAFLKGMYALAEGYQKTSEQEKAFNQYKEILKEFPGELNARLHLARLYETYKKDRRSALKYYRFIDKAIKEKKIVYQYASYIEERMRELSKIPDRG